MLSIDRWRGVAAADAHDASGGRGDMSPEIRQLVANVPLLGRALTIKCPAGDWLSVLQALDQAKPGDVLVIDIGGSQRVTGWGGTATAFAKSKGVAGCVLNGAVRDLDELVEQGFPVFALCASTRAPLRYKPGWVGDPVSVGGVVVQTGDLVIGDADGVVVIPAAEQEAVYSRLVVHRERMARLRDRLNRGDSFEQILSTS